MTISEFLSTKFSSVEHVHCIQDGWISVVYKASINGENVIVKLSPDHFEFAVDIDDLFLREAHFYTHLWHMLPCPRPTWVGDIGYRHVICMQDMSEMEFLPIKDVHDKCFLHAALRSLVNIHCTNVYDNKYPRDHERLWAQCSARVNAFEVNWSNRLSAHMMYHIREAVKNMKKTWRFLQRDAVLCHGDFKPANMLWRDSDRRLCVLDWQYVVFANGVTDVCFLAITSELQAEEIDWLISQFATLSNVSTEWVYNSWGYALVYFPLHFALWLGTEFEQNDGICDFIDSWTRLLNAYVGHPTSA